MDDTCANGRRASDQDTDFWIPLNVNATNNKKCQVQRDKVGNMGKLL